MRKDVAPELCHQQVEIAVGNRETKQFDLVVDVGNEVLFEDRKFEFLNRCTE